MKNFKTKTISFLQKNIFGMIIGALLVGGIQLVSAGYSFTGSEIYYDNTTSKGSSTNLQGSLDDIYGKLNYGNAAASQILSGKTALVGGSKVTGSMTDRGAVSASLNTSTTSYTIPAGYHNGSGKVSISTQSKTVNPTAAGFTVSPDSGKVLSSVVVNGDSDLVAGNIVRGVNIFGVTGSASVFKSYTLSKTTATVKAIYNRQVKTSSCKDTSTVKIGDNDITTSGWSNKLGTDSTTYYFGAFTLGKWKRMSVYYAPSSANCYNTVYTTFSVKVPGLANTNDYSLILALSTNYSSSNNNSDDYGFRIAGKTLYTHYIKCAASSGGSSQDWQYRAIEGGQWLDTSETSKTDNALQTTCSISSDGTITLKLESKEWENTSAKETWETRGSVFYLEGKVFYN